MFEVDDRKIEATLRDQVDGLDSSKFDERAELLRAGSNLSSKG